MSKEKSTGIIPEEYVKLLKDYHEDHPVHKFNLAENQKHFLIAWFTLENFAKPPTHICRIVGISQQAYKKWLSNPEFNQAQESCLKHMTYLFTMVDMNILAKAIDPKNTDPRWAKMIKDGQIAAAKLAKPRMNYNLNVETSASDMDKLNSLIDASNKKAE